MVEAHADAADSLVEAAAHGDVEALARIMALHDGNMRRICMVVTADPTLVDEAVQAAWIRAWRGLRTLRDSARLRAWLMSVAANEARQLIRARSRRASYERRVDLPGSHLDGSRRAEVLDVVAAVSRLEPEDRRLVALRYVGDLTSEEIAREIGGSASAVRGRLARILERLRRDLDQ